MLYYLHLHHASIVREFGQNFQYTLQHRTGVQLTQCLTMIRWEMTLGIGIGNNTFSEIQFIFDTIIIWS